MPAVAMSWRRCAKKEEDKRAMSVIVAETCGGVFCFLHFSRAYDIIIRRLVSFKFMSCIFKEL